MKIEELVLKPLRLLKRWPKNYRSGNVDAIITSIVRFGFCGCPRVWRDTVMAGNHAVDALKALHGRGADAPHGIVCDGQDWLVPCLDISRLSRAEAEAFAVADNRIPELAVVDKERLAKLLQDFAVKDAALMASTGYAEADLKSLLKDMAKSETVPAEFPAVDDSTNFRCPKCGFEWSGQSQ